MVFLVYQWLNRTAVCCLLPCNELVHLVHADSCRPSCFWLRSREAPHYWTQLTFLDFGGASSLFSLGLEMIVNKESKTCLCELWLIFALSCHLGFKSRNKGLMDLNFGSWYFSMWLLVSNRVEAEMTLEWCCKTLQTGIRALKGKLKLYCKRKTLLLGNWVKMLFNIYKEYAHAFSFLKKLYWWECSK